MDDELVAVVVAEKCLFKGQIFGATSNGGAVINISNGIALKFIADNDKFVTIQVLTSGIGKPIKNQSWQKSKVVKVKAQVKPKKETKQTVFVESDDVKKRDLL